jgi:hypothetical protein
VRAADLVVVQGARETRETLARWNAAPGPVLRRWVPLSAAIAAALLASVWAVALVSTPDPTPLIFPGLGRPVRPEHALEILFRNGLVLALHAMACVAGYIASTSLPREAERYSGAWRRIHDAAGPVAIAWVTAATIFSLATQAYALGGYASTLSLHLGIAPGTLLLALLPHALPELTALFLPLAAWLVASRRGEWSQLMAATFATVTVAVPVLVAAALWETWVAPRILGALAV